MLEEFPCRLSPWEAARHLPDADGTVFLDSASDVGISVLATAPVGMVTGRDWGEVARALDALRRPSDPAFERLPDGALIGTVDYNGAFCFGVFPELLVHEHAGGRWFDSGNARRLLARAPSPERPASVPPPLFQSGMTRHGFEAMVRRAQDFITSGDIYQVNLSQRFSAPWTGDPRLLHARLRRISPTAYSARVRLGGRHIVSSSPELFLDITGRRMVTRPIKGTRPRSGDADADRIAAERLLASDKERAELLMITDLERNDLGQVCEFGSVRVPRLLDLESFGQVHHLVSTVEGTLRRDIPAARAVAACLPGGSITGAPKSRATEIIRELEPVPRGLYTGVLGFLGFNGTSRLSIVIRTLIHEAGELHFHVGAGIVADSIPPMEYDETLAKAAGLLAACGARDAAPRPPRPA